MIDVASSERLPSVRRSAVRVLCLSLALAAAIELLLVLAALLAGRAEGAVSYLLDWLARLPWAVMVCMGTWLGLELGRGRTLVLALAGLIAAPAASLAARSAAQALQVGALGAVAHSGYPPLGAPSLAVAGLRGAEYFILGVVVGLLGRWSGAGAHHHAGVGLLVGAVFGTALFMLTAASTGDPLLAPPAVPAWAINELLFPAGCALILLSVRDTATRRPRRGLATTPG